jgi:hypothetical protein
MVTDTKWKTAFEAALKESDPKRLQDRIEQALNAIMERVDELMDDPERRPEHDEICCALSTLNSLQI